MRYLLSLLTLCLVVSLASAQTGTQKLRAQADLSAGFKRVAGPVLTAADDDDCTPPPCSGIIDPWTCECYPDIKDPWENEVVARRMRQVQSLETAMQRGEGKDFLPQALVTRAKRMHPGNSAEALYERSRMYLRAAQK